MVLWGAEVPRALKKEVFVDQEGKRLHFQQVRKLEALGDVITEDGGTAASWTGRGVASTRNFQRLRRLFLSRRTPVLARVRALARGPGACYEYTTPRGT